MGDETRGVTGSDSVRVHQQSASSSTLLISSPTVHCPPQDSGHYPHIYWLPLCLAESPARFLVAICIDMQPQATLSPFLCQRFHTLIWSCLDYDLHKSAVFYAERYFTMDQKNHDARHLYATALLRAGQTYSAMYLVNVPLEVRCSGCLEIKARCCTALGRHRQAREALEECMQDTGYTPTRTFLNYVLLPFVSFKYLCAPASMSSRTARTFPEEAVLRCRSGTEALRGNLPEKASLSFRQALALNPMLWEAFEGLCAIGSLYSLATGLNASHFYSRLNTSNR